jgi:TorA maturation chaperone TorD
MHKQLPMYQEQLENFIYHHIHAWAEDYVAQNKDDYPDVTLYEAMDNEFRTFVEQLAERFSDEIKPRFGDV